MNKGWFPRCYKVRDAHRELALAELCRCVDALVKMHDPVMAGIHSSICMRLLGEIVGHLYAMRARQHAGIGMPEFFGHGGLQVVWLGRARQRRHRIARVDLGLGRGDDREQQ